MDVEMIRNIIKNKSADEIRQYLEVETDRLEGMTGQQLLRYMATVPSKPHRDECITALQVLDYNRSVGSLPGYDCPNCLNKGYFMDVDDEGNTFMKSCKCMYIRQTKKNAARSGLGDLLDKTFDNFSVREDWQRSVYNVAKDFAGRTGGEWMYIGGQTGSGKTHLCSAAANQRLKRGQQVVYMLWTMEIKRLKRLATDPAYDKLFDRYKRAQVLYIDDFFKGKVTEADITIAYELINYRYNRKELITIISSELYPNEVSHLDEALGGRICERSGNYVFGIERDKSRNYRLNGALRRGEKNDG